MESYEMPKGGHMTAGSLLGLLAMLGMTAGQGNGVVDKKTRCVLEGLPRVGFYDGKGAPQDDLFPFAVNA
jgi:hypothetical protein